jgi:hypothetical protein
MIHINLNKNIKPVSIQKLHQCQKCSGSFPERNYNRHSKLCGNIKNRLKANKKK